MPKRWLTTGKMAEYCGVSFRTVIRWIERNELKAIQLPGRGDNRIEVSECLQFMQKYNISIPKELQAFTRRVLIIEDDAETVVAIGTILQMAGFEIHIAADSFAAGTILTTFLPAVVIVNTKMPGLHGVDVLSQIRNIEQLSAVKILVIANLSELEKQSALSMGANALLDMPFTKTTLLQSLKSISGLEPLWSENTQQEAP